MYLYIRNWAIVYKSNERKSLLWFLQWCTVQEYFGDSTDNLIFEDGKIKKYENSNQFIKDSKRYFTEKELKEEKRKNEELLQIANKKVKKELELDVKNQEPNEYQRKLYLLKQMKRW